MIAMVAYTLSVATLTLAVNYTVNYLIKLYRRKTRTSKTTPTISASVDPAFKRDIQETIELIQNYKEKYNLKRFIQRAVYKEIMRCEHANENSEAFGLYLRAIDDEERHMKEYIKRAEQIYKSQEVLRQRELQRNSA